ncbi:MAG: hypothetical protein QM754_02490 [Tepidisphaeraceae bacterium]
MLTNAHVWPQWDCWLLPFFVFALVAASKERWLLAGMLIGGGAAFKGQILIVAPILLLWPIFSGKFAAALRVVIGVGLMAALVGLPWMLYTPAARYWLAEALAMTAMCGLLVGARRRFDWISIAAIVVTTAWAVWVCVRVGNGAWLWAIGGAWALAAAVLPRWTNRRWLAPVLAAQLTLAVFFAGWALGGRFEWLTLSYGRPQTQYPAMAMGAENLPRILSTGYRFGLNSPVTLPGLPAMEMRQFLAMLFGVTLVLCGIGAALHARRRDPRVMIALAAPWVLMFTLMPQMHERYLLWGAVVMCAGFGISGGLALLATALSFYSAMNMSLGMVGRDPNLLPWWNAITSGVSPDAAWALLVLAAISLYVAIAIEFRPKRKPEVRPAEVPDAIESKDDVFAEPPRENLPLVSVVPV